MAVSRNTVSVGLILIAAICLVTLITVKWAKRKEHFIEHFYDEKEYAIRHAVMNAFDTLIKRKATPKEIEKYTTEFNSVDEALTAIKQDFHIEDFKEAGISMSQVTEEESALPLKFEMINETPIKEAKIIERPLIPKVAAAAVKTVKTVEAFEDRVSFERGELRTYVNEMRVFLNYLEARTTI